MVEEKTKRIDFGAIIKSIFERSKPPLVPISQHYRIGPDGYPKGAKICSSTMGYAITTSKRGEVIKVAQCTNSDAYNPQPKEVVCYYVEDIPQ